MNNRFYTYLHRLVSSGEVICVGSGTRERKQSSYGRNKAWYAVVKDNDWYPVVVKSGISKSESEDLEVRLISIYNPVGNTHKTTLQAKRLDTDYIDENYCYDETSPTGLRYKKYNGQHGSRKRVPGDVAGYIEKQYYRIRVKGCNRLVHRVIWYICKGEDPIADFVIDHIDGNPCNNKIENLRKATLSENSMNKLCKDNETGFRGVTLNCNGYVASWVDSFKGKSKLFSIVKYGQDLALCLAIEYRNRMLQKCGVESPERQCGVYERPEMLRNLSEFELSKMIECNLPSNNQSGVLGVSKSVSGKNISWVFIRKINGNTCRKSFSVSKYGDDLARSLASEFAKRFYGEEPRCVENYSLSDTNIMLNDDTGFKNKSGIIGIMFMHSEKGEFILSHKTVNYKRLSKRFYIKELGLLESIALAIRWRNSLVV